ncbi:MAG: hypothetical protein WDN24_18300 [Sphingomonas sp.]
MSSESRSRTRSSRPTHCRSRARSSPCPLISARGGLLPGAIARQRIGISDAIGRFGERHAANPEFFASEAQWATRFVHRFTVANYLIVHYYMSVGPTDLGRMFADFWRFEGDRIVEHWDVVQPVPEQTRSGNPMW